MIDLRVGLANQREFLFEVQTLNSKISNGWSMFTVPGPVQLPPGLSAPWRCRWAPWLLQGQLPCEWGDFQFWGASELNRTTNHPDAKIQIFSFLCFEHLGNRWVPPPPGMIASRVSVNPILEEYKSNTIFVMAGCPEPGVTAGDSEVTCQGHLQTSAKSHLEKWIEHSSLVSTSD